MYEQRLPQHGYPMEHPFNKDGYRHVLAEPDPSIPDTQPESDLTNKPIPSKQYRRKISNKVLLTLHDRAPTLKVSDDRLSATGEKGYALLRASHSVTKGSWYYEVTVKQMPTGSASRIGWSQQLSNLQAPLGYDKFGYSWRSRKGTVFHESCGKHYADGGYKKGDVLGIMIVLPENEVSKKLTPTYKDKPLVKFRSHLYYEDKDDVAESLKNLKPVPGSKVIFFKNGKSYGDAFKEIYGGVYYPSVSLYKNINVSVNFGPKFKHPPKNMTFRGMNERCDEAMAEQTMADLTYLVENDGKLR